MIHSAKVVHKPRNTIDFTFSDTIAGYVTAFDAGSDTFTLSYSADLLSFVVPQPRQTWWRAVAGALGLRDESLRYDRAAFLGYLPLALALVGAWSRRGRFWVATALLFALLALGPALQVGGATRFGPAGWELPLPYRLIGLQREKSSSTR